MPLSNTDAFKGVTGSDAAQSIQAYITIANIMWAGMGMVLESFEGYVFNEGTTTQPNHIKLSEDIFLT